MDKSLFFGNFIIIKETVKKEDEAVIQLQEIKVESAKLKQTIRNYDKKITLRIVCEEATHAFVWVKPKQNFIKRNPTLTIGPEPNAAA